MGIRVKKEPPSHLTALQALPNVGPKIAADLLRLGICSVSDLAGRDPRQLYHRLCAFDNKRLDPCLLDVFSALVHYADGGQALPWWHFSRLRKAAEKREEKPNATPRRRRSRS